MATNENLIPIPGRLHSVATEGHVAGADEIIDDNLSKDQQTINAEVNAAIGTGGSVDSRISAAINALDSTKSQSAGADGLALNIVEENGKITSISGSIASGTYDAAGSASAALSAAISAAATDATTKVNAAKSEIKGTATSACDTLGEAEALISAEKTRAQQAESSLSSGKADKATTLAGYGIADAYTKSETYTKTEVNGLVDTPHQEYVTVDAYANLPATGSKDTIYRVSNYNGSTSQVDASVYSEYAWNGSQYVFLCVKSQIGEVFDISVYNNNAKYADLAAALNGGANIPQSLQKGGMSVKFVQSSDNKYVQYRLTADDWSTDTEDWAIVDEGVYIENPEFVYVKTDKEGKILWAIKVDGNIYYGAGVPQQVIDYIEEKISSLSLDEYEDIVAFLSDYLGSDTTLKTLLDSKLDAEGLDPDALGTVQAVESPEYIQVTTDSEDKILEGITAEGVKQVNLPIDTPSATTEHIENPEWIEIKTDREGKILEGIKKSGEKVIPELESKSIDDKIISAKNDLQDSINSVYTQNIPQPSMVKFDIDHDMKDFTEFHDSFSMTPATTVAERIYHLYDELAALYPDYVKKYDPMADTDTTQTVVIDGVSYNITVYGMSNIKSAMSEAGFSDYPVYAKGVTDDIQETIHNIDGTSYTVTYTQTPAYRTYMYAFVCGIDYINTDINKKHKIMVTSNLHGNEVAAVVNLYLLMKQLCDGVVDDGNFYKLRAAFDIYVIPSINQYGNYHNTRCNARRVDLNRNFPIKNWDISGFNTIDNDNRCVFTGPNAGSEFETQLVIALSNYIKPVWAFDHHNYGEGTGGVYTGIVNHNGVLLTKLAQQAAVDIAIADAKNYPEYFGKAYHDVLFGITADAPGHNASINLGRIHCWWAENMAKMAGVIEVGSIISWRNGEQVEPYNWMGKEVLSINEYIVRIQWLRYLQFLMDNYEFI